MSFIQYILQVQVVLSKLSKTYFQDKLNYDN